MYTVHTGISGYHFVHTAESLREAKRVKQTLLNVRGAYTIAHIKDANGEMI